ncbi:MAG: hypothetical protein AB7O24_11050 [Kofleriaceae bacterium]
MRPGDRGCAITVVISLVLAGATAHAQSPEAEALFREARQLVKRGQIAAGCDKFAASERLESSIGTLLNLGDCRERLGALATAWAAFRKAEALAKRTGSDRQQAEATRRAARLEPRLSYLSIEVPVRISGLVVRRNRDPIDTAMWGTALPVDPGQYVVVAEAPGYVAWRTTITVRDEAKRHSVVVPALSAVPVPRVAPQIVTEPRPSSATDVAVTKRIEPSTWTGTRKVAVVLGVAGAGALGVGGYYGWLAGSREDRANDRCPAIDCSDPEALRLNRSAREAATRANVLLAAGGGALATSVVLWLVGAPSDRVVAATADSNHVGVTYTGRF